MDTGPNPQEPRKRRGQRLWTDAQRAEMAEICRARQVWANSTGPRTEKGKSISRLNALKHGAYSRPVLNFMKHFKNYQAFLRLLWAKRSQLARFQRNELGDQYKEHTYFYTPRLTPRMPKRSKRGHKKPQFPVQNFPTASFIFAQMN